MGFERESERERLNAEQEDELRRAALEEAVSDLKDLDLATSKIDRFYSLTNAAQAAAVLARYDEATELAEELLDLASSYKANWNYGNAIHYAHSALGLVALGKGDVEKAIHHLLAAGNTPGSPQLDTFGPSMMLARALMREGQFESAAEYLRQCQTFWEMGKEWIETWDEMLKRKVIPNCVMHAFR